MSLLIVHGDKSNKHGEMTEEFKGRIMAALKRADAHDTLVITGGVTRKGTSSEAEMGAAFIKALELESAPRILTEDLSTTTGENIRFVKNLIAECGIEFDDVKVFHRDAAIAKTRILYRKLWPELDVLTFIACKEESGFWYHAIARRITLAMAYIDPYEKNVLWRLFKRGFRNA